jgi:uncharacterized protein YyaL (SSP411 family)
VSCGIRDGPPSGCRVRPQTNLDMTTKRLAAIALVMSGLLTMRPLRAQASDKATAIKWEGWSDAVFARARQEHRLVILDLEANWCHWCHVMDAETYSSSAVVALIGSKFVAVRVDQDSRPDLSARYQDYGWPATIIFDGEGRELAKRAGFIPPEPMISMLKAFVEDPTPGPSIVPPPSLELSTATVLPKALRVEMFARYLDEYDSAHGSWGGPLKYLDWDGVELALVGTKSGDAGDERMARQTLLAQQALLDPVWGGVYQYSAGGDWKEPHFEKIMMMQAQNLRIYALAYAQTGDAAYLAAAKSIEKYLQNFLTGPDGAFYSSQDADLVPGQHSADYFALDDAARRKRGVPRVDKNVYARENGWAIRALAVLSGATGDDAPALAAVKAANAIIRTRSLPGGGFRHGASDEAGPYLADTLAMGQAFLELYAVTGDRIWLTRAEHAAYFIRKEFASDQGSRTAGFIAARSELRGAPPVLDRDENVSVARFENLLFQYTGNKVDREMTGRAMRYLAAPTVVGRFQPAGVLLADLESRSDPLHATAVGSKSDPAAKALFKEALRYPGAYRRIEWWDPHEGPLPNRDTHYPAFERAALFVCAEGRCGLPLYAPSEIKASFDALTRVDKQNDGRAK